MSELYNVLNRTIGKIKDTNDMLSCCQQDVTYLHNRLSPKVHGMHIKSTNNVVTLSIKCNNIVKCLTPYDYRVITAVDGTQSVTIENVTGDIFLDNTDSILELDMHDQGVTSIEIFSAYNLNKLVLYDNDITVLDLSHCPNLQFLHMHNNPICDNDDYLHNLIDCMNSLTDRMMFSTGSIILYPWYGLEVLICKDYKDQYIKYPAGLTTLDLEEGVLYGIVENDSISYCKYDGTHMTAYSEMNRHHSLRKMLESDICLKKNWVFGSAIMYSDDWYSCSWDFRQNNIADMWETAEKGFGLTFGSMDQFTNTIPGFNKFNIKDIRRFGSSVDTEDTLPTGLDYLSDHNWKQFLTDGTPEEELAYHKYLIGKYKHGDMILSIIAGTQWGSNSKDKRFGYIPNACIALNDTVTPRGTSSLQLDSLCTSMRYLTNNSDTLSFSFGLDPKHSESISGVREVLGKYGENHVVVVSAGNSGDGLPYTHESTGNYSSYAGNYYDTCASGSSVSKQTSTLFIGACDHAYVTLPFCNSSVDVEMMSTSRDSYLTSFGDQIFVWDNYYKALTCGSGTSYAAPICGCVLLLMRKIYSKMFPQETSFGKHSRFMEHVRKRWCIHNDNIMDFAEGFGVPNILAKPYAPALIDNTTMSDWEPVIECPKEIILGEALPLVCRFNGTGVKKQCTVQPKLSYIAIDSHNTIYPLVPNEELELQIYSNSSLKQVEQGEQQYYTHNFYSENIRTSVLDNNVQEIENSVELCESLFTTDYCSEQVIRSANPSDNCNEFTIQFTVDFKDKTHPTDIGTYRICRDLLYFYNNGELGRLFIDGASYTTGDSCISLTDSTLICHKYYSDVASRLKTCSETETIGYKLVNKIDTAANTFAIITVSVSNDVIKYYFNGTCIGNILLCPSDDIQLSKVYVNAQSLCHTGIVCVRMYNRVLSEKEIIQNTIAMLNSNFEEDAET